MKFTYTLEADTAAELDEKIAAAVTEYQSTRDLDVSIEPDPPEYEPSQAMYDYAADLAANDGVPGVPIITNWEVRKGSGSNLIISGIVWNHPERGSDTYITITSKYWTNDQIPGFLDNMCGYNLGHRVISLASRRLYAIDKAQPKAVPA